MSDIGKGTFSIKLEQRTAGRTDHLGRGFVGLSIVLAESFQAQQGTEVVAEDLRGHVLLLYVPTRSGDGLQIEMMIDPFERLFCAPARVVKRAEVSSGPHGESGRLVSSTHTRPSGVARRIRRAAIGVRSIE
jgi:hypothetical protein